VQFPRDMITLLHCRKGALLVEDLRLRVFLLAHIMQQNHVTKLEPAAILQ
jgi:hypothetical protein